MTLLRAILFSLFNDDDSSLGWIVTAIVVVANDDDDDDVADAANGWTGFDVSITTTSTGSLVDLLKFHNDTLPPEVKVTNTAGLMRLHCTSHT